MFRHKVSEQRSRSYSQATNLKRKQSSHRFVSSEMKLLLYLTLSDDTQAAFIMYKSFVRLPEGEFNACSVKLIFH